MPTLAVERTRNGVLQSADSATLVVLDSSGQEILVPTAVFPHAEGLYSYTIDTLIPGNYTATWTFTNVGYPDDVISRMFTLDPAQAVPEGVTLMNIERRIARRVGPYYAFTANEGSTLARFSATRLQSSLALGSYEDLYMLRRGVTTEMAWIPDFVQDDRLRLVERYDAGSGWLFADRVWTVAPSAPYREFVELMYLDPEQELRPSTLDGLRRCFFWDQVQLTTTGSTSSAVNISKIAPWITSPTQVREVSSGWSGYAPTRLPWWQVRRSGSNLYLQTQGPVSGYLIIDALRPASSLVNQELSLTGPNDDMDIVYIDPDYAVWAGIIELWKNCPERLQPLVHEQLRPAREDAASEFTKKSLNLVNQMSDRVLINFGQADLAYAQIGNLPEPVV